MLKPEIRPFCIGLLCFLSVSFAHAGEQTTLTITADSYAEPVSIRDFTGHWQGRFDGGRNAFLQGRAELSHRDERQEIALLWRYDYLLDFSPETAELYNAYAKRLSPAVQKTYPLQITAHYTEAWGVRWAPVFTLMHNLTVSPGFNLLQGYKLTDGRVDGKLTFRNPGFQGHDIDSVVANINYDYDEPRLYEQKLDWHPRNPDGQGGSLDILTEWRPDTARRLSLQLYDVYGEMFWRNVPSTLYRFNYQASPQSHSLNGQLAVNGHFSQRLPMRGKLSGSCDLTGPWIAGFNLDANRYVGLGELTVGYRAGNWTTTLLWEPQTQAMGMDIEHPWLHLRWLADNLNTNRAHRLGITLGVHAPW